MSGFVFALIALAVLLNDAVRNAKSNASMNSFQGCFDSGRRGLDQLGKGPARVCVWFSDRLGGVSLKKKEGRPASRSMMLTSVGSLGDGKPSSTRSKKPPRARRKRPPRKREYQRTCAWVGVDHRCYRRLPSHAFRSESLAGPRSRWA